MSKDPSAIVDTLARQIGKHGQVPQSLFDWLDDELELGDDTDSASYVAAILEECAAWLRTVGR